MVEHAGRQEEPWIPTMPRARCLVHACWRLGMTS